MEFARVWRFLRYVVGLQLGFSSEIPQPVPRWASKLFLEIIEKTAVQNALPRKVLS